MGHVGLAFIRLKLASRLPENDVLLLRKLLFYHELTRDVNKLTALMYLKKGMSSIRNFSVIWLFHISRINVYLDYIWYFSCFVDKLWLSWWDGSLRFFRFIIFFKNIYYIYICILLIYSLVIILKFEKLNIKTVYVWRFLDKLFLRFISKYFHMPSCTPNYPTIILECRYINVYV